MALAFAETINGFVSNSHDPLPALSLVGAWFIAAAAVIVTVVLSLAAVVSTFSREGHRDRQLFLAVAATFVATAELVVCAVRFGIV